MLSIKVRLQKNWIEFAVRVRPPPVLILTWCLIESRIRRTCVVDQFLSRTGVGTLCIEISKTNKQANKQGLIKLVSECKLTTHMELFRSFFSCFSWRLVFWLLSQGTAATALAGIYAGLAATDRPYSDIRNMKWGWHLLFHSCSPKNRKKNPTNETTAWECLHCFYFFYFFYLANNF